MLLLAVFQAGAQTDGADFFEKNVRPLFIQRCFGCHGAGASPMGGLRLDNRESILHGGGRGPAVVPGKPGESLLIKAIRQTDDSLKMPPGKKLADAEIATLAQWIAMGAPWPASTSPAAEAAANKVLGFCPAERSRAAAG